MQGIQFKTGIDANGFKTGLDRMRQEMGSFTQQLGAGFKQNVLSMFTGAFAANAVMAGIREVFTGWRDRLHELREVGNVSKQIGATFKETEILMGSAERAGVGMETVATAFAKVARSVADIRADAPEATKLLDAFNTLGITSSQVNSMGRLQVLQQVFANLRDRASGGDVGESQIAALQKVMGESGGKLIPLIARGIGGIGEVNLTQPGVQQGIGQLQENMPKVKALLRRVTDDLQAKLGIGLSWLSGGIGEGDPYSGMLTKPLAEAVGRGGRGMVNSALGADPFRAGAAEQAERAAKAEKVFIDKLKEEIRLLQMRNAPVEERIRLLQAEQATLGGGTEVERLRAQKRNLEIESELARMMPVAAVQALRSNPSNSAVNSLAAIGGFVGGAASFNPVVSAVNQGNVHLARIYSAVSRLASGVSRSGWGDTEF